ncbi:hypothetical protein [Streptomyces sp. NPDC057428]|uniref:hypothetical protein n=1 Tax=Streptomyces sp. NPDC057428 TaxID=3346129 RepID=UPI0036940B65
MVLRYAGPSGEAPRIGEVPFDPAVKYMATFHTDAVGSARIHVKGAVDVLLDRCTHMPVPVAMAAPARVIAARRQAFRTRSPAGGAGGASRSRAAVRRWPSSPSPGTSPTSRPPPWPSTPSSFSGCGTH